ncbi:MAG: glycosyltransferase family 4 protein [Frankia sp.]|nr:glycosyltransferase family 4 protein [Frankia sp.]
MRVGLVCPYTWEVPGGVQAHVRDLAEALLALGHDVSVLAPADDDADLPPYITPGGRAMPVPYNGSVARLAFSPRAATRVRRWLRAGEFDVVHVHEPTAPSLSLLTVWATSAPVVATFHTAQAKSRALSAAQAALQPALEKIIARIAVSPEARRMVVEHLGGTALLIPNGVNAARFAAARAARAPHGPNRTVGFLGRLDETRKGLPVLLAAFSELAARRQDVRLVVAGRGDVDEVRRELAPDVARRVEFVGQISEADKPAFYASLDAFVAPNLGGESFGIVLLEAMATGTPVVASDIEAFRAVLDGGSGGALFPAEDARALAVALAELLDDAPRRAALSARATELVAGYDWSVIAAQIVHVYETVMPARVPALPGASGPP